MNFRIYMMEKLSCVVQLIRRKKYKLAGYKNIDDSVILESNLLLDKVYPQGIYIGKNSLIAAGVTILTHEHVRRDEEKPRMPFVTNTYIGENCFIGVNATILPGVKIGNEVIVGAGTVVTKDVPDNSVIVGNPGKILDKKIMMSDKAVLAEYNY